MRSCGWGLCPQLVLVLGGYPCAPVPTGPEPGLSNVDGCWAGVPGQAGGSQELVWGGSFGVEEQVVAGANKTSSQLICSHSLQTLLQVCFSSLPISSLTQPSAGCS